MLNCRLCGSPIDYPFAEAMLCGRNVQYFDCSSCGYVQTEYPTWLDEAYSLPINKYDTGIMQRNLQNVRLVLATLAMMNQRFSHVVDYAGGYGILVRLLRDIGIEAFWLDAYSENLLAKGFEYDGETASLVTAFEVFEHFVEPCKEIVNLLNVAPNILLTTTLISDPAPLPSDWWYYGLAHGQHIGFFRLRTLEYLAKKFNLHLVSDGSSVHFFSEKRYGLRWWNLFRYIAKSFPYLFRIGMTPKTYPDYLLLQRS